MSISRTDSEIQQDVLEELRWDARIEETDVGVEVDDGIVTLTGTVSSWAKRFAAQDAAHRVPCVRDVANDIDVKLPGSAGHTDTEIARAVRHALEWGVGVPEKYIRSTVSEGRVTLEGDVSYWSERDAAEDAIRNLAGVRAVSNKIEVAPPKVLRNEVQTAIEEALERQAEREARRVNIVVHDGRVTLSGIVHSWAEREAVIGAARGMVGVESVESSIDVESC